MHFEEGRIYFFDSHGDLWVTCDSDHPEVQNFGPTGFSHPSGLGEIGMFISVALGETRDTDYVVLSKYGVVRDPIDGDDEWVTVDTVAGEGK